MKHLRFLSLFILLISTSTSKAEDVCINSSGNKVSCITSLSDTQGNDSCGNNCLYKVITDQNGASVLHIYKKDVSQSASILAGAFSPNFYTDNVVKDAKGNPIPLQKIMLDDDFENIGLYAFANSGAQIYSASGKFVFSNGETYFSGGRSNPATLNGDVEFNNSLNQAVEDGIINGDILISDSVKSITGWSFNQSTINGNIIIPSSVNIIGQHAFRYLDITGNIYCASGTEVCYEMIKKGCKNEVSCINSLNNLLEAGKFSDYPEGCISLSVGASCTKCKNENYVLEEGDCYRKRYTLPEADEVTSNDNENMIEWIFE